MDFENILKIFMKVYQNREQNRENSRLLLKQRWMSPWQLKNVTSKRKSMETRLKRNPPSYL